MILLADCPHCDARNETGGHNYLVCRACSLSFAHRPMARVLCTSEDLARAMEKANRRWLNTALRVRLYDHERQTWKDRYMARAVSLAAFWGRNWKERMAR